uniref:Uncharacterized protein n=1 Tax=Cyanothece sp. (strain PCC 7425 / ATCC 29141) TaxID=395961 RepID=B8HMH9_CYAP4
MMRLLLPLAGIVLSATSVSAVPDSSLLSHARQSLSVRQSESKAAIAALRDQGSPGLQAFLQTYPQPLPAERSTPTPGSQRAILDQICQQKDCYASHLYWYTDLEQAKQAAQSSGKPILSLRLLGRLDQDLSCANSRFFRIILYPNQEIAQLLRDRFILHWQSVRPVPTVTIDFGDGRRLERTLTGNSIHYILDAQGRPVDALPGLYGPAAFKRQLLLSKPLARQASGLTGSAHTALLRQYHRDRLAALETAWSQDLQRLGMNLSRDLPPPSVNQPPSAELASRIAITKAVVELPILQRISRAELAPLTDAAAWQKLAQFYRQEARLDANSIALMRQKNPAWQTWTGRDPLQPVLQNFEQAIALDTVKNQYLLHSQLHEWFIAGETTAEVNSLTERVYSQLFLTPSSDPWLGLLPMDSYSGIEHEGLTQFLVHP